MLPEARLLQTLSRHREDAAGVRRGRIPAASAGLRGLNRAGGDEKSPPVPKIIETPFRFSERSAECNSMKTFKGLTQDGTQESGMVQTGRRQQAASLHTGGVQTGLCGGRG